MKYTKILENIEELSEKNAGQFIREELKIALESEKFVDDDEITIESATKKQNGDVFSVKYTSADGNRRLVFVYNQYDYYIYEQYKIYVGKVLKKDLENKEQHKLGKIKFNNLVAKYVEKSLGDKEAKKYLNLANANIKEEFEEEQLI